MTVLGNPEISEFSVIVCLLEQLVKLDIGRRKNDFAAIDGLHQREVAVNVMGTAVGGIVDAAAYAENVAPEFLVAEAQLYLLV